MTILDVDLRTEALSPTALTASIAAVRRNWICLGIFAALVVWAVFFPFSGDGDSVLHYLNAVDTSGHWERALFAWTRPGYKIPLSLFASHGILPAHIFGAAITAAVAWNTMRLAEELNMPRPWLAGLFLACQPYVFALGSDTMTEMPMALGLVLAIRWWRNKRFALACLLVGFLPSVRPEGFFFGVIFGVMVLVMFARSRRRTPDRWLKDNLWPTVGLLACLSIGLAVWVLLCWTVSNLHDPLLVLHYWNWPPGSYSAYGKGPILHYAANWPGYCGLPLFAAFMAGIVPAIRRSMWLPWVMWATVIGVHSVLYWGGWFASCGLIRIMACSSPVTAVICLYGWNTFAALMGSQFRKPATIAFSIVAAVWAVGDYCFNREHMHCFPLQRCADFVKREHLLDSRPYFFTGDKIATAMLLGPNLPADKQVEMECDPQLVRKSLAALPIGSIGVWDDEQAAVWHGHTIQDLTSHGFTVLFDAKTPVYSFSSFVHGRCLFDVHYVVLRKDRQAM